MIKVIFEEFEDTWIAYFTDPLFKGIVESGSTKKEAFNQLMTSLKVKICYDNSIEF